MCSRKIHRTLYMPDKTIAIVNIDKRVKCTQNSNDRGLDFERPRRERSIANGKIYFAVEFHVRDNVTISVFNEIFSIKIVYEDVGELLISTTIANNNVHRQSAPIVMAILKVNNY